MVYRKATSEDTGTLVEIRKRQLVDEGIEPNMYTRDDYRKQGIATLLLEKLVEEAKCCDIKKLWLGASKLGRPVYEKFGFRQTAEWLDMNIDL